MSLFSPISNFPFSYLNNPSFSFLLQIKPIPENYNSYIIIFSFLRLFIHIYLFAMKQITHTLSSNVNP